MSQKSILNETSIMLNVVKKYLDINYYYDQKELFEESFLSHPNYPSLYAITDSLNYLSIDNIAAKIPKEQFVELPDLFLSFFEGELVLVRKNNSSVVIEKEKGNSVPLSSNEFLEKWNQVIVLIGPNSKLNNYQIQKTYSKWLLYLLPVISFILLSVFLTSFSLERLIFLTTTAVGLAVSVLILQEKFGIKTELGSKLCNISTNTSCDSVITSSNSVIYKNISYYDLPILFFGINLFAILLDNESAGFVISFLSILAIPFLLYSIWLQKVKIKKWCFLCLLVLLIIVIQAGFFPFINTAFFQITLVSIVNYLLASAMVVTAWFSFKFLFENNGKLKAELNSHKRFKRNFKVFASFLKEIEVLEGLQGLKGIKFGSSDSIIKIKLFLSPSCGHCHKAFNDAKSIYEKYPDKISLDIVFNVNPENVENPYLPVVETILALNFTNKENAIDALNDWHIKKMGLNEWKEKWPIINNSMLVTGQIQKQYEWCVANNFNYTPVKIVNDMLFPNEYELSDLNYFINEYLDVKESSGNLKIV